MDIKFIGKALCCFLTPSNGVKVEIAVSETSENGHCNLYLVMTSYSESGNCDDFVAKTFDCTVNNGVPMLFLSEEEPETFELQGTVCTLKNFEGKGTLEIKAPDFESQNITLKEVEAFYF